MIEVIATVAVGAIVSVVANDGWGAVNFAATNPLEYLMSGTVIREELAPLHSDADVQLVKAAQRCIMAALDHSRASRIVLVDESDGADGAPVIELPPAALRAVAQLLGLMGERKPIVLIPQGHELTTQEAATFLNVSRPFVIREIDAGRIGCRMVGSHRRIAYEDLTRYRDTMRASREAALQKLADEAQELGLGYD